MLGRFQQIIPYKGLNPESLLKIAEDRIATIIEQFKLVKQINLVVQPPKQWPKDVYNYYTTDLALYIVIIKAKAEDSNSGGARAVHREIEANITNQIIDALIDNPGCKNFRVEVSKDSAIYNAQNSHYKGVEVIPIV